MTRPEDAIAVARERVAAARARGGYAVELGASERPEGLVLEELLELAIAAPNFSEVRSTRATGAPVTFAKRALLRLLRQYTYDLLEQRRAQHVVIARSIADLDERLGRLG